jgi:inward rectifier potassium channel
MQDETFPRNDLSAVSPGVTAGPVTVEEKENRDLGFGSVIASASRDRLLNQDGSFNVKRSGIPQLTSINLYHWLLFISWPRFLGLVLTLYFLSNVAFGLVYSSFGAAIVDTSSEPFTNIFIRGFFFSVQTFATIGYGTIHPIGVMPNLMVTIESYYSLLANALITGVVFARFSRPTAAIKFSNVAVVAPYRGITAFMFRLVNARSNQLIEVEVKLMVTYKKIIDGVTQRRFDFLELERRKVSFLPLSWTVVHPIDTASPLFGMTEQDVVDSDAEFLVLLTGIDEAFAQTVHARSSFKPNEVRWNAKFATIYTAMNEGDPIAIDIRKLSAIELITDN